ncbi:DUF6177 family protein [Actinomycetota bacterium Odt1-20B]
MTKDVITLTPTMPDINTILAGLFAGGPDLGVHSVAEGAVVQLCAPDGRPLVAVEAPQLVHHPSEAPRLLGDQVPLPDGPFWWTEARATTSIPEAERLAGSFAGRVATVLNGTVWPPEAAHTDVVPLTTDLATAPPADPTAPPAVDALTDKAAVVMQDRPVIAMTTWLADAVRTAAESDRALHLVTPPHTRLTSAARTALHGHPNRWVVQHPEHGFYDGLSGAQLRWREGAFTPVRDEDSDALPAPAFKPDTDSGERQLIVSIRTAHPPTADLTLGHALETAFQHLTGAPPAGWGTSEPINLPWSTRQLTDFARSRAPRPTLLLALGHPDHGPAQATLQVTRTTAGVEEHITLTLGYGEDETPPLAMIENLATTLAAEHNLLSMLTSLRTARRDLTTLPVFEAPPIPHSFTLGPEAVREVGLTHAQHLPHDLTPIRLGPAADPALHYHLGDGTDTQAWAALQQLTTHLSKA